MLLRLRFVVLEVARRFVEGGCLKEAAALTYTTLFAVVPVMTVTYLMLALLPAFTGMGERIEQFIFEHFVPASGAELRGQLSVFAEQARGLTVWGLVFLFITSYLLLVNVERTFNDIWEADQPRRGVSRFLLYWCVLTLGPPAVVAATAASSYVLSLPVLTDVGVVLPREQLIAALPWVISGSAFTFMFYALPNVPVKFAHALCGGVLTMLLFQGALSLFTFLVSGASWQVVYGTFAVIPLFLTWVYVCWSLVLAGAVLVKVLGETMPEAFLDAPLVASLKLLGTLYHAQGEGRVVAHDELDQWHARSRSSDRTFGRLRAAGYVMASDTGWLLGRDLNRNSLWDLCQSIGVDIRTSGTQQAPDSPQLASRLQAAIDGARAPLDIPLNALVGEFIESPAHKELLNGSP